MLPVVLWAHREHQRRRQERDWLERVGGNLGLRQKKHETNAEFRARIHAILKLPVDRKSLFDDGE